MNFFGVKCAVLSRQPLIGCSSKTGGNQSDMGCSEHKTGCPTRSLSTFGFSWRLRVHIVSASTEPTANCVQKKCFQAEVLMLPGYTQHDTVCFQAPVQQIVTGLPIASKKSEAVLARLLHGGSCQYSNAGLIKYS